jgi:hypothetical protein
MAGEGTVATSAAEVRDTRGISKPLLVLEISNCAEFAGLMVPMPTLCAKLCEVVKIKMLMMNIFCLIFFNYWWLVLMNYLRKGDFILILPIFNANIQV